jgi:hypothetical protein
LIIDANNWTRNDVPLLHDSLERGLRQLQPEDFAAVMTTRADKAKLGFVRKAAGR